MSSFFTRERVSYYCTAILVSALFVQVLSIFRDKEIGGDFPAFYAVGKVALHYPHRELYNIELQDKEYYAVTGVRATSPFPYPPWFTIPLALFAELPYLVALGIWSTISVAFVMGGFWLIARAVELPSSWDYLGILACLAFPPYLFYTLINGQPAAFGFFILGLTYFLQRNGSPLIAGIVLSFLTYKPTLLAFIGPMLLITKQWRILSGLVMGGIMLALTSLLWAGVDGYKGFFRLIALFAQGTKSTTEIFQTHKYIDVGAALRLLVGPQHTLRLILLFATLPIIFISWYRIGSQPLSWSLAITCGLLLNFYSPIYDCILLIFAVLLVGIHTINHWLIAALYLVPLITVGVAKLTGVQLYTLVLIVFLIHLIRRAVPYFRSAEPRAANVSCSG
jgi:Glycosyltransferase family 87